MQTICHLFTLLAAQESVLISVTIGPVRCSATSVVSVLNSVTLFRCGILVSSGTPKGFSFAHPNTSCVSPSVIGGVPNPTVIVTGSRSSIPRRKKMVHQSEGLQCFRCQSLWFGFFKKKFLKISVRTCGILYMWYIYICMYIYIRILMRRDEA